MWLHNSAFLVSKYLCIRKIIWVEIPTCLVLRNTTHLWTQPVNNDTGFVYTDNIQTSDPTPFIVQHQTQNEGSREACRSQQLTTEQLSTIRYYCIILTFPMYIPHRILQSFIRQIFHSRRSTTRSERCDIIRSKICKPNDEKLFQSGIHQLVKVGSIENSTSTYSAQVHVANEEWQKIHDSYLQSK